VRRERPDGDAVEQVGVQVEQLRDEKIRPVRLGDGRFAAHVFRDV
jgi:hypothetical protein